MSCNYEGIWTWNLSLNTNVTDNLRPMTCKIFAYIFVYPTTQYKYKKTNTESLVTDLHQWPHVTFYNAVQSTSANKTASFLVIVAVKQSGPPGFVSAVTEAIHLCDHKLNARYSWSASDTWYNAWFLTPPPPRGDPSLLPAVSLDSLLLSDGLLPNVCSIREHKVFSQWPSVPNRLQQLCVAVGADVWIKITVSSEWNLVCSHMQNAVFVKRKHQIWSSKLEKSCFVKLLMLT